MNASDGILKYFALIYKWTLFGKCLIKIFLEKTIANDSESKTKELFVGVAKFIAFYIV